MLVQLAVGASLILATVVMHAICLEFLIDSLRPMASTIRRRFRRQWKTIILAITVLGVFAAHVVEMWLWAAVFLITGEMTSIEAALYFSISTFTTVGFGDLYLSEDWRLLSSIEAANGMLMFGWSTAFIFEVMSRLWIRQSEAIS